MMKKYSLKQKEDFLNWKSEGFFEFETKDLGSKKKKKEIEEQFSKTKNLGNLLEVFFNTDVFRKEMQVLEHGFATATGSNWDKMVVNFRGIKAVINDREHTVNLYNGENGFS